jgi:hypothetical protein
MSNREWRGLPESFRRNPIKFTEALRSFAPDSRVVSKQEYYNPDAWPRMKHFSLTPDDGSKANDNYDLIHWNETTCKCVKCREKNNNNNQIERK